MALHCHGNSFLKEHLVKILKFSTEIAFSCSNRIYIRFQDQIGNQCAKIDQCAKFQPNWTKDKGARISTSNNVGNSSMSSYRSDSDDVVKIFNPLRDFFPDHHNATLGGNWTTIKVCPPLPILNFTIIIPLEFFTNADWLKKSQHTQFWTLFCCS